MPPSRTAPEGLKAQSSTTPSLEHLVYLLGPLWVLSTQRSCKGLSPRYELDAIPNELALATLRYARDYILYAYEEARFELAKIIGQIDTGALTTRSMLLGLKVLYSFYRVYRHRSVGKVGLECAESTKRHQSEFGNHEIEAACALACVPSLSRQIERLDFEHL